MKAVAELFQRSAAAWPGISVAPGDFADLVAEKLTGHPPAPEEVAALSGADLYMACACSAGEPQALAAFEAHYLTAAPAALARMRLDAAEIQEVLQIVRVKFLVGSNGRRPRIRDLAGQGNLRGLVRVAAIRTALNLRSASRRRGEEPSANLPELLAGGVDPAAAIGAAEVRGALKGAFEEALGGLDARQRNILRLHLCHRLGIDEIGRLHRVHRATAARWLERIRDQLRRDTRRALAEKRAGATELELDALFGLADSKLEISFDRLLASRGESTDLT